MTDLSLDTQTVTKTSDIENVLQQIELLLDTSPYDVIGELNYGSDFEKFLWNLNASNYDIERYITSKIQSEVDLLGYSVLVEVSILNGTESDIILADISVARDGVRYVKRYKIDK